MTLSETRLRTYLYNISTGENASKIPRLFYNNNNILFYSVIFYIVIHNTILIFYNTTISYTGAVMLKRVPAMSITILNKQYCHNKPSGVTLCLKFLVELMSHWKAIAAVICHLRNNPATVLMRLEGGNSETTIAYYYYYYYYYHHITTPPP